MSELDLAGCFRLLSLDPNTRDPLVLKQLRRRVLLDSHPDKCADRSEAAVAAANERFVALNAALDRVMVYFRDVEDCARAGIPYRGESAGGGGTDRDADRDADRADDADAANTPPTRLFEHGFTEQYWFEAAFEELTEDQRRIDVDAAPASAQDKARAATWDEAMNERFLHAFAQLMPSKPMRGAPREITTDDEVWTVPPPDPDEIERALERNSTAVVSDRDRLRQPRRDLHRSIAARCGVSAHRSVEDHLTTNLLAEEINHDFGKFEQPTYRATARAYTARRFDHLSSLFVYSAEREAEVRSDLDNRRALQPRNTATRDVSLASLYNDDAGYQRYEARAAQETALRNAQYAKRQEMQAKLRAVMQQRMSASKDPTLWGVESPN